MSEIEKLTKIPFPPADTDEAFARSIIETILNYSLNRHIHMLDDGGYLKSKKYFKERGWLNNNPQKTLQLKFDLMDEAVRVFQPLILEKLHERSKVNNQ
ncbi:hypothetical protein [Zooshikella ganghwensis]|uniref:hypothetical protein n=1 Tax=Zooshikella ganghwensis TaxID=202772 RepID=UPI000482FA42|nr:hypothetical protein [Zooshikella ganghwensis]